MRRHAAHSPSPLSKTLLDRVPSSLTTSAHKSHVIPSSSAYSASSLSIGPRPSSPRSTPLPNLDPFTPTCFWCLLYAPCHCSSATDIPTSSIHVAATFPSPLLQHRHPLLWLTTNTPCPFPAQLLTFFVISMQLQTLVLLFLIGRTLTCSTRPGFLANQVRHRLRTLPLDISRSQATKSLHANLWHHETPCTLTALIGLSTTVAAPPPHDRHAVPSVNTIQAILLPYGPLVHPHLRPQ
jgi:hypothetical protein